MRRAPLPLVLLAAGCGIVGPRQHEASATTIERSFAPHRELVIGGEAVVDFLRRRTALLVGGPATLQVEAEDGRITPALRMVSVGTDTGETAVQAAAAAVTGDGYFLTAAHALGGGPVHLLIEVRGRVQCAPARVVWSAPGRADLALLYATLRPEAWFDMVPDRQLTAGQILVSHAHLQGTAAGGMEVDIDLSAFEPYEVLTLPHDTPFCKGFSGSAAVTLEGQIVGVNTSTGMDTIFRRRTWIARPSPDLLKRLIEEDRRFRE